MKTFNFSDQAVYVLCTTIFEFLMHFRRLLHKHTHTITFCGGHSINPVSVREFLGGEMRFTLLRCASCRPTNSQFFTKQQNETNVLNEEEVMCVCVTDSTVGILLLPSNAYVLFFLLDGWLAHTRKWWNQICKLWTALCPLGTSYLGLGTKRCQLNVKYVWLNLMVSRLEFIYTKRNYDMS